MAASHLELAIRRKPRNISKIAHVLRTAANVAMAWNVAGQRDNYQNCRSCWASRPWLGRSRWAMTQCSGRLQASWPSLGTARSVASRLGASSTPEFTVSDSHFWAAAQFPSPSSLYAGASHRRSATSIQGMFPCSPCLPGPASSLCLVLHWGQMRLSACSSAPWAESFASLLLLFCRGATMCSIQPGCLALFLLQ